MFTFMTDLLLIGNCQLTCFSLIRLFLPFSTFLSCLHFFMQYRVVCGFSRISKLFIALRDATHFFLFLWWNLDTAKSCWKWICLFVLLGIYLFSLCIHAFQHLSMNSYDTFWEWFPSLCSWGTGSLYFLKLCFLFRFPVWSPVSSSQTLRDAVHSQLQNCPISHSYMSSGDQTQRVKLVQNVLLSTKVYHGSSVGILKICSAWIFLCFDTENQVTR